ncbi:TRAP transporter large permease [Pelomicrobium sp.]|jgi:tripartite ATP-independent transporter DctM subunit|uniref:TRAP transporter large permease n=1 Tax=Pelomicrobium sp. TaxID=2815319 RepID=UPI002FDD9784
MMDYLALFMLLAMFVLIFMGVQVAFALMGTALFFGYLVFHDAVIFQFMEKIEDIASNYVLAAVPLFVFMGTMLERSGIAEKLFEAVHLWTRRLPGGLALGTVVMCVIFAASTGVVGATETVVGLLAIPAMLKYAYNKPLICGTICAGGSLGTIIPPSVVVVVLGPVANVSVGDLLVGMIFPGLILSSLYLLYIFLLCAIRPDYGPRIPPGSQDPPLSDRLRITFYALIPPVLMVLAVLGSIIFGLAAPTEAAGLGAFGSILLTILYRKFSLATLKDAVLKTLRITSMIMAILLGGTIFTGVFFASGGIDLTNKLVAHLDLGPWALLALLLTICFLAGFVLDWISILLIFIPIFMPLVNAAGFNPVWFCILFLIIIQTSYLTPPLAPAIFYLRGIAPPSITLMDMYKGVIPFILLQVATLFIVIIFPQTVLWLPEKVLGFR